MSMSLFKKVLTASLIIAAPVVSAKYSLVLDKSALNFLSTKNVNVTESHSFDRFSGTIDEDGKLALSIDLSSVNTMIPIRNERMQSMLFKVSDFAEARFVAALDKDLLSLAPGESKMASIKGEMTISGITQPASFDVAIHALNNGQLSAATVKPTLINASDYGLDAGIEALREIAMLQNISTSVPLSFYVVFDKN